MRTEIAQVSGAREVARRALRWVSGTAVAAPGGVTWTTTAAPGTPACDDLYDGTAGVLAAFAEARLCGVTEFDKVAGAAAGGLRYIAADSRDRGAWPESGQAAAPDTSLYCGLAGAVAALRMWADVTGDEQAASAARGMLTDLARIVTTGPDSGTRDLIEGDAGVLVVLARYGGPGTAAAAALLADRLLAGARRIEGGPDWPASPGGTVSMPNFSHGAAGIAFALALVSGPLRRPDLLETAAAAARRLVSIGTRPDGTLAVPYAVPPAGDGPTVSYGWCHGPAGTVRLFGLLDRLQPGGWASAASACRRAVTSSGLPARLYPGFWDNIGQCCGTAGVGEMALDRYQETGASRWLGWAAELAGDVLARRIADETGVRWSHTQHQARPAELEPAAGWMQGTAGIGSWLLRLWRVARDGPAAPRLRWPDRP